MEKVDDELVSLWDYLSPEQRERLKELGVIG
jgi:hypothetical protein